MTKKPFHSMSEDFDELEIEPVRMREPDIPDDWLEAETGEASKPRDKSAGEIHMSWLNENSHSKPIVDTKPSTINDKPREWWILPDGQTVEFEPQHFRSTHVIEKSAYDEVVAKMNFAYGECQEWRKDYDALKAELSLAKQDRDSWKQSFLTQQEAGNKYIGELKAEADKLAEALERISNFSVTDDPGRFGAFIGAGAVDIAIVALTNWKEFIDGK